MGSLSWEKTPGTSEKFQLIVFHDVEFIAGPGDLFVMGDDDRGQALALMEVPDKAHDRLTRLPVQVAGGLVGEQEFRLVDQSPGDGDALLFSAREKAGLLAGSVREEDLVEDPGGPPVGFRPVESGDQERQQDVLRGAELGKQVEGLENKADLGVA